MFLQISFEDKECLIGKWLLIKGYTESIHGSSEEFSWCENHGMAECE